jgi:hypothetical protein
MELVPWVLVLANYAGSVDTALVMIPITHPGVAHAKIGWLGGGCRTRIVIARDGKNFESAGSGELGAGPDVA